MHTRFASTHNEVSNLRQNGFGMWRARKPQYIVWGC